MDYKKIKLSLIYIMIVAALSGVFVVVGLQYNLHSPIPFKDDKTIIIPKGSSLSTIGNILGKNGIIGHKSVFVWTTRLRGMSEELQAGEFFIPARSSLSEILSILAYGKTVQHSLTFPEGLTSEQIKALLNENNILIGTVNFEIEEGSLLPDTYFYSRGDNKEDVLGWMKEDLDELLDGLWEERPENWSIKTKKEAVTLASIIEKETGKPEERAIIASVFLNRLKNNMRLQSDPTVIYGITGGEPLGRAIRQSELDRETPYNTYKIRGLPPSPIANPGRDSLEAVFNPKVTNYLYFVADGTGGHVFAETLEEHNKNVSEWRKIESQFR